MNDEWSRCPICFEDYSPIHRPTTFICGHSTCIDHCKGSQGLRCCPICRNPLRQNGEYNVSYNLEEAARLYQSIKDTIDWSTIKLPPASDANDPRSSSLEMIHRDEVYARRLQAELSQENTTDRRRGAQTPRRNQAAPVVAIRTGSAASGTDQPSGRMKNCGHGCDLVSTRQCCTCSDRRPHPSGGGYETYLDGQGIVNAATRNQFYCSTCKRR